MWSKSQLMRVRTDRFDEDSRATRREVRRLERQFNAARKRRSSTVESSFNKWKTALGASCKKSHSKVAAYWWSKIASSEGNPHQMLKSVSTLFGENTLKSYLFLRPPIFTIAWTRISTASEHLLCRRWQLRLSQIIIRHTSITLDPSMLV